MATLTPKQILAHLQDERDGVTLYTALAELEKNPQKAAFFSALAQTEQRHAERWVKMLGETQTPIPSYRVGWRTRVLIMVARRFGVGAVLPTLAQREKIDAAAYQAGGESPTAADERMHARLLQEAAATSSGGLEGAAVARIEGRHSAAGGNALRAAVLGANDGLVSNLSLVMGVAGAALDGKQILVTGLAGLLAGAFSMALGEWLSVQSSRELYTKQIEIEKEEITAHPEEEADELALIYQSRGVSAEQAHAMADRILTDRASALDALVREELGIDPKQLGGSAWEAALTSFVLFSVGAIIPVIPFFFTAGMTAVLFSVLLSTIGLFAIGAGITLFTGRGVLFSGARQVGFGLAAAAATYGIGRLIGVSIGG